MTGNRRQGFIAAHLQQTFLLEKSAYKLIRPILGATYLRAAKAYENLDTHIIREILNEQGDALRDAMNAHYARCILRYSNMALGMIRAGARKADDPTTAENPFWKRQLSAWISNQGGKQIKEIDRTTRDNINSLITEGIDEGLGAAEIAGNIRSLAGEFTRARALTIAVTETHNASMFSLQETALADSAATGLVLQKQWAAVEDSRTREAHAAADGQTVDLDEDFIVGGEKMAYPGDPVASAGNVINCRCTLIYIPKETP